MKRNMNEYADQGTALLNNHWQYDMTSDEVRDLLHEIMAGNIEANYYTINRIYRAGLYCGYRLRQNEERRKRHAGTFNSK